MAGRGSGGVGVSRPTRVFVLNLKYETTWVELKAHMETIGEVVKADVFTGPDGRSKGIGFVEYTSAEDAERAIAEMSETNLDGRNILVREDRDTAPPRTNGAGAGGRGGRGGRGGPGSNMECHKCGQTGHLMRFCPKVIPLEESAVKCFNCGGLNHLARDCLATVQPGGPNSCFRCGGYGHLAAVCPTVAVNQRCHRCKGLGHLAAACPNTVPPPRPAAAEM